MSRHETTAEGSGLSRRRIVLLAGVASVLVAIGVVATITQSGAGKGGDRKQCAANLEGIGRACIGYADSHKGEFPSSLGALLQSAGASLQAADVVCPNADRKGRGGAYVFVPGRRKTDDPNTILAYEPLGNHKKKPGGHVLLVSGVVNWLDDKQHEAAMAQLKSHAGQPPAESKH